MHFNSQLALKSLKEASASVFQSQNYTSYDHTAFQERLENGKLRVFIMKNNDLMALANKTESTYKNNIKSVAHKKLVVDSDLSTKRVSSPRWNGLQSASANLQSMDKLAIGDIEDNIIYNHDTDAWYADVTVQDGRIRDYIESFTGKDIPMPTQAQIINKPSKDRSDRYDDWFISGLCVVEKNAYRHHH
jgi:hypothetical protein